MIEKKQRHRYAIDAIDAFGLALLLIGVIIFSWGLLINPPDSVSQLVVQFHEEWTPGFVTDGILLLFVNRIIRRNERRRVLLQVGSLSNEFALDAIRLARTEGWLEDGSLNQLDYERAKLVDADLHNARMQGCALNFSDLRRSNLTYANLSGADLTGANLEDVDLRWANLTGAKLSWANLRYAQLDGAILDDVEAEFSTIDKELEDHPKFNRAVVGGHMSTRQIELVRNSFALVEQAGEPAIRIFYEKRFASAPDVRPMFPQDIDRQARKFLQSLRVVVSSLDTPEESLSVLQRLGERHRKYGVQSYHFQRVGAVLLATLQDLLGQNFTDETRDAWSSAYGFIANVMQHAGSDVRV